MEQAEQMTLEEALTELEAGGELLNVLRSTMDEGGEIPLLGSSPKLH